MMTVAVALSKISVGMMELSTTRKFRRPSTRKTAGADFKIPGFQGGPQRGDGGAAAATAADGGLVEAGAALTGAVEILSLIHI